MSDDIRNHIVKSSRGDIYKFYIEVKTLILEKYSGKDKVQKTILVEGVLDYSLDMDENDKIHIIYVNNKRELNYINYPQDVQGINILKVNDNCMIDSIKIKLVQSRLNIFYRLNDMYKNTSYLCHNYIYDLKWLEQITVPKYRVPYFIDNDKEYIYILYCKNININEYRIKRFNLSKGLWEEIEDNIIIEGSMNLDFAITPNNIGIICFNKIINNSSHTLIKYKDFNVEDSNWSTNIHISEVNTNTFKPVSFYKNDFTYIMWKQGRDIRYRKSYNMTKWSREYTVNLSEQNLEKCLFINKGLNDDNSKIIQIYLSSGINSYPYINTKVIEFYNNENINDYRVNNYVLDEASVDLNESLQSGTEVRNVKKSLGRKNSVNINNLFLHLLKVFKQEKEKMLENINDKNQDIQELLTKLESQNKTIRSFNDVNFNLKKQIEHLNSSMKDNEVLEETHKLEFENLIESKDKEFNSLNELNLDLKKQIESLNKSINEYKEKLIFLRNEKDSSDKDGLQKIEIYENQITKLVEEKDRLMTINVKREEELLEKIKENELILKKQKMEFIDIIDLKDKEFKTLNETNLELKKEIESLYNSMDEYKDELNNLKTEKDLSDKGVIQNIGNYKSEIIKLEKEKDKFIINSKKIEDEYIEKIKENEFMLQSHKEELKNIIEAKDKEIKTINEENSELKNKVNILEESINKYSDKIYSLKAKKVQEEKKYYMNINKYENQIRELKEKNEEIIMKSNNKIYSLVRVIQEKDSMMDKLRKMMKK